MGEGGLICKGKVRIVQYCRYDDKHPVGFSGWTKWSVYPGGVKEGSCVEIES